MRYIPGLLQARSYLGKSCATYFKDKAPLSGYAAPAGFGLVSLRAAYVVPLEQQGARFAFLFAVPDGDLSRCRVADVVSLPSAAAGDAFLSCTVADDSSATPLSTGIGVRKTGKAKPVAYWSVDADRGAFAREPLSVLGWDNKLRCREPETGD